MFYLEWRRGIMKLEDGVAVKAGTGPRAADAEPFQIKLR